MTAQRLAFWLGILLVLGSFYFIGSQIWQYKTRILDWHPSVETVLTMVLVSLLYGMSNYLLSLSWINLLNRGHPPAQASRLTGVYAKSQIAKYLPGNVMHIASRHVMARAEGVSHWLLASAALYEIIGLFTAASLIAVIGIALSDAVPATFRWLIVAAPLLLLAYFFSYPLLRRFRPSLPELSMKRLLKSLLLYLLFFLSAGMGLWMLVWVDSGQIAGNMMVTLISAFAIAWVAGFVTPGSPSGIGIREAVLVLLLELVLTTGQAILLAIIYRLITVIGDVFFFLLFAFRKHTEY